jgi:hypothetical protein
LTIKGFLQRTYDKLAEQFFTGYACGINPEFRDRIRQIIDRTTPAPHL